VELLALPLALAAGTLALGGVLYEAGLRPPWLERWRLEWMTPSDRLAERAYRAFLAGQTQQGLARFEDAVNRNPSSPYRWCDYGEALLAAGNGAQAAKAMRRGLELGPYVAPILMREVNFAFRTGDRKSALQSGRRLLAMVESYDETVFAAWRHMEVPAAELVESGLPDGRSAQSYLRILMATGSLDDAATAWAWIERRGYASDPLADEYAGLLVRSGQPETAFDAWRSYAGAREPGYPGANAVFNGSFEREPAGRVFDWRIDAAEGFSAERDSTVAATGRYSLRLSFAGTRNLQFQHVSQRVCVRPGVWRFEARLKTEGITSDEGIGFRIVDPEIPARLDIRTERLTGTHNWATIPVVFTTRPDTRLVEIQVVRNRSLKFDNKLGGVAWIDDVSLRRPAG
jgi:tetratricopeptide (TPR) repeat protein